MDGSFPLTGDAATSDVENNEKHLTENSLN